MKRVHQFLEAHDNRLPEGRDPEAIVSKTVAEFRVYWPWRAKTVRDDQIPMIDTILTLTAFAMTMMVLKELIRANNAWYDPLCELFIAPGSARMGLAQLAGRAKMLWIGVGGRNARLCLKNSRPSPAIRILHEWTRYAKEAAGKHAWRSCAERVSRRAGKLPGARE